MSDFLERISKLSPKRLALLALDLQSRVEALERRANEPIAVVGLSCRFPGAEDAEAYWRLLRDGVDAVTETPSSRWSVADLYDPDPDAPGKLATRWGGYLAAPADFEPQFFGISPREAATLDPQQRLLLEVAWEALEDAGYPPDRLIGSLTGVFVGISGGDYGQMLLAGDRAELDMYFATGNAHSLAAGRLSYVLGLQGPSLAVDTSCSSSLVAVHLALQSLRRNECRLALAGGVNLILTPEATIAMSRAHMMSADGRCKAFDASADGFVRAEGCGLVALKRLSDALADGDRVLAVIHGSAVNQDGRSNGLTAPNGPAQESVIRQALADAGVNGGDIGYVEAHGTGTSLGDPIEAGALGAALGAGRPPERPLWIGSVKSNFGHAESAAGIAGLIKVILMLQHQSIAPSLHLNRPNPYIPWDALPLKVPVALTPWSDTAPRLAGVSSFGFSGTNAHVIVAEAPAPEALPRHGARPLHLLALSARDPQALRETAATYARHLADHPEIALPDLAHTANAGRMHWSHRLALTAATPDQARIALERFTADGETDGAHGRWPGGRPPGTAFLFPGQGPQYTGMGRRLYDTQPTYRDLIDRCAELLRPQLDQPLLSILFGDNALLDETRYTQPALFAVEVALAELWQAWGLRPTVVLGHSAGELAAACVAGVFSLEDGLKLAVARGRLMHALPHNGEMAVVFSDERRVADIIARCAQQVAIAVINGPDNVVLSGERTAIQDVLVQLDAEGIKSRRLNIAIAAHSPLMDPALDAFEQVAASITYTPPNIDVISCLTGQIADADIATPNYWRRHLRQPVRFHDALTALSASAARLLIEISPTPTLTPMARRNAQAADRVWATSLRAGRDDWDELLRNLGELYVHGAQVDWAGFDRDEPWRRVAAPTYRFQRQRYWRTPSPRAGGAAHSTDHSAHPLLGRRVRSPLLEHVVFETELAAANPSWLTHHRVRDAILMPLPGYAEMALAGAREALGGRDHALLGLMIHQPLVLPDGETRTLQVSVERPTDASAVVKIHSYDAGADAWVLHAAGRLEVAATPGSSVETPAAIQARCREDLTGQDLYARLRDLGLAFGPVFQGLRRVWRGPREALGWVSLPEAVSDTELRRYRVHPALLDACFHLLGAPLVDESETFLLVGLDRLQFWGAPGRELWAYVRLQVDDAAAAEHFSADMQFLDPEGHLVGEARGLHLKRATRDALHRAVQTRQSDGWLYDVVWEPKPLARRVSSPTPDLADQLRDAFEIESVEHGLADYVAEMPRLDAVATAWIRKALTQLGWDLQPGDRVTTAALADRLRIAPKHSRLLARFLSMLVEDGDLVREGAEWLVVTTLPPVADAELAALQSRCAPGPELAIADRCGAALADVLRDQVDPLQLLFPGGETARAENLYRDTPAARAYHALMQRAVAAIVATWPSDRQLRILEIGAGTGATTAAVLPTLSAGRASYVFTDLSPLFLRQAEEKFGAYPFVRFQRLDIERDPLAQSFEPQAFDLIIAANVLHATAVLDDSLAHVHRLLAPGGQLLVLESTAPQRWVDITFGLTDGWWRFQDAARRPDHPLLSRATWRDLLSAAGFDQPIAVPNAGPEQALLLARAPDTMGRPDSASRWLILADSGGVGRALAERLTASGATVCTARRASAFVQHDSASFSVDARDPDQVRRLVDNVRPQTVVDLWGLDPEPASVGDAVPTVAPGVQNALALAQVLADRVDRVPPKLWLVTRNAQSVGELNTPTDPAPAPLWGLGRVIALEHPELWGGLVDLPLTADPTADADHLLHELTQPDGETEIAWRGGARSVARLAPAALAPTRAEWRATPDGAYLITGGLGGLGLRVAEWLAERGARHLVLLGRRGPSEAATRVLARLADVGVQVVVERVSVTDLEALRGVRSRIEAAGQRLAGVVHAAVVLADGLLARQTWDRFTQVLDPKALGAWNLHTLTRDLPLDFFVLFSSGISLYGGRGLGNYAAANAYLDGLAHFRRAQGLPALSINWGAWSEVGTAVTRDLGQRITLQGMSLIPPEDGLRLLGELLREDRPQIAVLPVNWATLLAQFAPGHAPRLFARMVQAAPPSRSATTNSAERAASEADAARRLGDLPIAARLTALVEILRAESARVLHLPLEQVDPERSLSELGLDSLMAIELKNRVETRLGLNAPVRIFLEGLRLSEIAERVQELLFGAAPTEPAPPAAVDAGEARRLLEQIDQLSGDQIDDLLTGLLAEGG